MKELIRVTTLDAIPLTIVCRKLGDEEAMLDVIIVDVPIDPPMFEVRVLLDEEREFEVLSVVIVAEAEVRSEIVVVANCDVPVAVNDPVVNDENVGEEETERTLPVQRRLDPVVIRLDGVV